jgi:hypothetical protein
VTDHVDHRCVLLRPAGCVSPVAAAAQPLTQLGQQRQQHGTARVAVMTGSTTRPRTRNVLWPDQPTGQRAGPAAVVGRYRCQ